MLIQSNRLDHAANDAMRNFRQSSRIFAPLVWTQFVWTPFVWTLLAWVGFAVPATRADWNVPRGDSLSSGHVTTTLPADLVEVWQSELGEAVETTPVIAGQRLFATDVMGGVYAVSIGQSDRGRIIWQRPLDIGFIAAPSVYTGDPGDPDDDLVLVGDVEGTVMALAATDGHTVWQHATEGEIDAAASILDDRAFVTSQDGTLTALTVRDGKVLWTYTIDDQLRCAATIAGGQTFLGGCDAKLHRVDLQTGMAVGDPIEIGGPTGSTPAVSDGTLVLPIMGGIVYGFELDSGRQKWAYEDAGQAQEYRTDAAVDGAIAVVASARKHVDALSLETGERQWRYTLKRRSDASPIIAGDDVWIASSDGRLIRLDKADGREKWVFEIRGSFFASPAIDDDRLYVIDDDGVLRCFASPAS